MDIMKYYSNTKGRGVMESLDTITPREQVCLLHNLAHKLFYKSDNTCFEFRITFDSKKWNIDNIDFIHDFVKKVVKAERKLSIILVREFSKTLRIHYHGLIYGNQKRLIKMRAYCKQLFGRDCNIVPITYPISYIPYMMKQFYFNEKVELSEFVTNVFLKDMFLNILKGNMTNDVEKVYTWTDLEDYNNNREKEKNQNKRTFVYVRYRKY